MNVKKGAGLRQQSGEVGKLKCEVQHAVRDYTLCGRCRKWRQKEGAAYERSRMGTLCFLAARLPADKRQK